MSVILHIGHDDNITDKANDKRTLVCKLSISYLRPGEKFLSTSENRQENCLHALHIRYLCLRSKPLICVSFNVILNALI